MFLSGKRALVTGSTSGIGLAIAQALAAEGAEVVLNGFGDPTEIENLCEALGAIHIGADLTTTAGVEDLMARAGPVDILVNNAGMQLRAPLLEFADSDWHRILDTNLTSAFLVGREAARYMTARGHGKIVNICSLQSEVVRPGIAPYAATKGALKMLTKGMCADLAPHGIQVNGIGPGYFATELTAPLVADEAFSAWVRGRTPAGRWGRVEDLVGTLIYLCSPAADFVNGQLVYVDGGMLAVL